jgi:hypothetical protein
MIGGKIFLYIGHFMNDIWFLYISPTLHKGERSQKQGYFKEIEEKYIEQIS